MNYKTNLLAFGYKNIFKPIAFTQDAEFVHNRISLIGETIENMDSIVSWFFRFRSKKLKRNVLGIEFENPIGLAAGFDYDGHMAKIMKQVGFGFNTVGSVTALAYEGNTKPRLARLPKSKSLLVNKGFKSEGAKAVARRLDKKNLTEHTIGISVGSTNSPLVDSIQKAINDYLTTFNIFKNKSYVKYFELNISCPNTKMTESFTTPANFERLVKKIQSLKITQPIFVKMPNEIDFKKSDELVSIAIKHGIRGFIFSNLVKDRTNPKLARDEIKKVEELKGNFSGLPTQENSLKLIRHTRKKFGKKIAIIGCGGTFSGQDAKDKLDAGADLVQLITGMIYEGPQLIGQICRELSSN